MKPRKAEFITSAVNPDGYPPTLPPEIAFAGRSNVGKSSLINALLGRRGLAKTSQSPGKTRLINFFSIESDRLRFVDLPGYGYAKVSKAERAAWRKMIERYLSTRETLAGVVLLVDSRRGLQDWEMDLIRWLGDNGIPHILVLTKSDKLKRRELDALKRSMKKDIGLDHTDYILTSTVKGQGLLDLWKRLELMGST